MHISVLVSMHIYVRVPVCVHTFMCLSLFVHVYLSATKSLTCRGGQAFPGDVLQLGKLLSAWETESQRRSSTPGEWRGGGSSALLLFCPLWVL